MEIYFVIWNQTSSHRFLAVVPKLNDWAEAESSLHDAKEKQGWAECDMFLMKFQ